MSNYPWEIKPVPKEEMVEVDGYRVGPPLDYIRVGAGGYYYPKAFLETGLEIYNLKLRPSDIFVVTFPKSGTTWTQELVWLVANDHDYKAASEKLLTQRFPFLEIPLFFTDPRIEQWMHNNHQGDPEQISNIWKMMCTNVPKIVGESPSPRFIKSHLPLSLLPPTLLDTTKVVYVARDPRDVAVSFYHHHKLFKMLGFSGDFKAFWKCFMEGRVDFAPYFPHLKEAWEKRNHPNMLFLFYEELVKDLPAAIRQVAKFLEKPITEEQVRRLSDHLHIDNFRKNPSVNAEEMRELGVLQEGENFIRKGKSGGWPAYFDEEMSMQADRWIEENLRGTGIFFPHKLQAKQG